VRRSVIDGLAEVLQDHHNTFEEDFSLDARFNAAYAILHIERSNPKLIQWATEVVEYGGNAATRRPSWVSIEATNLLGKTASRTVLSALASQLKGPVAGQPRPQWKQFRWKNPASEGYALHYAGNAPAAAIRALGALGQDAVSAIPLLARLYNGTKSRRADDDVVTRIEIIDTIWEIGEIGGDTSASTLADACATPDSSARSPFDVDMLRLTGTRALETAFTHWSEAHGQEVSRCPLWKVPRNHEMLRFRMDLRKQEKECTQPGECALALPG
jgi:hypothetical protein